MQQSPAAFFQLHFCIFPQTTCLPAHSSTLTLYSISLSHNRYRSESLYLRLVTPSLKVVAAAQLSLRSVCSFISVPFFVPAGTKEIQLNHHSIRDPEHLNILDFGVLQPDQTFRGWGGGNSQEAIIGGSLCFQNLEICAITFLNCTRRAGDKSLVPARPAAN